MTEYNEQANEHGERSEESETRHEGKTIFMTALFKGLRPGAGNAGSIFSWVPSQNTPNDHIRPKPRFSGPEGFEPDEVIFGCFWRG